MAVPVEQISLTQAKSRLPEVIEDVENEHRRVVITKHGKPAAVMISVKDLDALEDTLEYLSKEEALKRWKK